MVVTDMFSTLFSYVPHSLAKLLLAPEADTQQPTQHLFQAAVLFADVSGFTKLTEALAAKGDEGPEEITRLLNQYFSRMIALLESDQGDVVKFSGDALTVLFLAEDEPLSHALRRAHDAGYAMQELMKELAPVETSVGPVDLGLKVGIGGGEVTTLQVGGVFKRWEYVLSGEAMVQAAEVEKMAQRGDVILHPKVTNQLAAEALPPKPLVRPNDHENLEPEEIHARLRRYVPGAVRSWMVDTEFHDWLGVLRTMSILFISVEGINYEQPECIDLLHLFLRSAQETIYDYQGSINKLAVDDKGTIFLVLFGAPPFAHTDDPLRAVQCSLDIQDIAQSLGLGVKVGVTTGRVFSGPVGSDRRREYTVMGDAVNLAARLMSQAELHTTRCDKATRDLTHNHINYDALEPVSLKGKSKPVPLFQPTSVKPFVTQTTSSILVGRQDEQAIFQELTDEAKTGSSRVFLLEGDVGIGKSLLFDTFAASAESNGFVVHQSQEDSPQPRTPYAIWQPVFIQIFAMDYLENNEAIREQVEAIVTLLSPSSLPRLPLLNDLMDFDFPENDVTSGLSQALRKQGLESLLLDILIRNKPDVPVCLLLDNLHNMDSLSWDLLLQVVRCMQLQDNYMMLGLSSRPMGPSAMMYDAMQELKKLAHVRQQTLPPLSVEDVVALIASHLQAPADALPQNLVHLVHQRAGGNPLFVEECLRFLEHQQKLVVNLDNNLVQFTPPTEEEAQALLPNSLEGLLLARIDQLSPHLQLVLKVAAVLGRSFPYPPLHATLRQHTQWLDHMVREQTTALVQEGFTEPDLQGDEVSYWFKNVITQEVTYRSLLHQQRRDLHRYVAEWYESTYGTPAEEPTTSTISYPQIPSIHCSLLAYHWKQAEEPERELHYMQEAIQYALSCSAYSEAMQGIERALELVHKDDVSTQLSLHLQREELYNNLGLRNEQLQELERLANLAATLKTLEQIQVLLRKSRYHLALYQLQQAASLAEQATQKARDVASRRDEAQGLQFWGTSILRQGQTDKGFDLLQQSLSLAKDEDDVATQAAVMYWTSHYKLMQGEVEEAWEGLQQGLHFCETHQLREELIQFRNGIAMAHLHQQQWWEAIEVVEESRRLCQKWGTRNQEGYANLVLARIYVASKRYRDAQQLLRDNIKLCYQIGDREFEAYSHFMAGQTAWHIGQYKEAAHHNEQASRIVDESKIQHALSMTSLAQAFSLFWSQQYQEATQCLEQALGLATQHYLPDHFGKLWTLRGFIAEAQENWNEALEAFEHAVAVYRSMKKENAAQDAQAGIARIWLKLNEKAKALAVVDELLVQEEQGILIDVLEPFWICLTCVDVLRANDDPRAEEHLHVGYQRLQALAFTLEDEELQHSFLTRIPHHRTLAQYIESIESS